MRVTGFIRLLGVLLNMAHNDLMHTGVYPFRLSLRCEDAKFRIGSCPISHAPKEAIGNAILLHPHKSDGLI